MPGTELLTVVTWNVMGTEDPDEQERRGQEVGAVLERLRPDVVLLQEAWEGLAHRLAYRRGNGVAGEAPYADGRRFCVVLTPSGSARPGRTRHLLMPGSKLGIAYGAAITVAPIGGVPWCLISAHLPWGGRSEAARVEAVVHIDACAEEAAPYDAHPAVLGADMNATPDSASWRTLTGLQPVEGGNGMLWVDTWASVNSSRTDDGHTTGPAVPLSSRTAARAGSSRPELEPSRRIDGLFSRGWCYGRRGGPVAAEVVRSGAALRASDHLPVMARLSR